MRDEAELLMRELRRLAASVTEEEVQCVRSVVAKGDVDKIAVEELERIIDIAKRLWKEKGSEEAYEMFLYAYMSRAYKL